MLIHNRFTLDEYKVYRLQDTPDGGHTAALRINFTPGNTGPNLQILVSATSFVQASASVVVTGNWYLAEGDDNDNNTWLVSAINP